MVRTRIPYLLGLSNRCRLGDGTIVPIEEAEEADDEESFGDAGRLSSQSSWAASCDSSGMTGGSGGRRDRWALAKDL